MAEGLRVSSGRLSVHAQTVGTPAVDAFGLPHDWAPAADASLQGDSAGVRIEQHFIDRAMTSAKEATYGHPAVVRYAPARIDRRRRCRELRHPSGAAHHSSGEVAVRSGPGERLHCVLHPHVARDSSLRHAPSGRAHVLRDGPNADDERRRRLRFGGAARGAGGDQHCGGHHGPDISRVCGWPIAKSLSQSVERMERTEGRSCERDGTINAASAQVTAADAEVTSAAAELTQPGRRSSRTGLPR